MEFPKYFRYNELSKLWMAGLLSFPGVGTISGRALNVSLWRLMRPLSSILYVWVFCVGSFSGK